jgi:hypothetical protein
MSINAFSPKRTAKIAVGGQFTRSKAIFWIETAK